MAKILVDPDELFNNLNESIDLTMGDRIPKWLWERALSKIAHTDAQSVERPKAGWARTGQSFVNPNKFMNFCCSNCLCDLDEHIRIEPNFCPNCGADMRSKGD